MYPHLCGMKDLEHPSFEHFLGCTLPGLFTALDFPERNTGVTEFVDEFLYL